MEPTPHVSVPGIDLPYYFYNIATYFTDNWPVFFGIGKSIVGVIIAIAIPLSVFLIIAIILTVENLKRIRNLEDEKFNKPIEPAYIEEKADPLLAAQWRKVVEEADSLNPNDWKQAIIDADKLLESLVTRLGYQGATLGEQLKRTTTGDFKSRDAAWDAHLVRNRIAHEAGFEINQLEAKRVIGLYRQVFDEFYHISG